MGDGFFDSLITEKTDCIFFVVKKEEFDVKNDIDKRIGLNLSDKDEILISYFKEKYDIFEKEEVIKIYQGSQLLIGIIIKNEYRLCDLMFDISNSEKQSVLTNFTWEGQYQVMVSKKNNCIEIYEEGNEIRNIINVDDGSYINLLCMYSINKLNSTFYLFQSSIIIKPQYWNERLSIDLLFKYSIMKNNNKRDSQINDNREMRVVNKNESNVNCMDYFIFSKESSFEIYSFTWSKLIMIKVPLSISNFYIQENSSIIYIEVVNNDESLERIVIEDIYSHHFKLNCIQMELPVTLESNQYFGFSLVYVSDKKKRHTNSNSNNNNCNNGNCSNNENNNGILNSNIIPLFIKWRLNNDNCSRYVLTQFTIQKNIENYSNHIKTINTVGHESSDKVQKDIKNANLDIENKTNVILDDNSNFSAICKFDSISKYPGETVYLNITIVPNKNNKVNYLNLEVSIEYDKKSPIIPLYDKMPLNYFNNSFKNNEEAIYNSDSDYNESNLTLLYPIKICLPGIYECPKITVLDLVTNNKYVIDKYPLIVCKNNRSLNSKNM
ncbi:hypothetical protein FG386_003077 [Cryptosporidium ryanae]|uniref:uncharacterized protein n=1 Tax=Cryptosporidium ryanae TaxID=515981 RepID=UPI00351AA135|nr:hypothetical protein FG386_003077 [Cryptosporidium ryanae]